MRDERHVVGFLGKITVAAQNQMRLQPPFQVTVCRLDIAVFLWLARLIERGSIPWCAHSARYSGSVNDNDNRRGGEVWLSSGAGLNPSSRAARRTACVAVEL